MELRLASPQLIAIGSNQNALGGSVPRETFLDATQLEDLYIREQEGWREWSLLSTDGDTAALIQLVSDHKAHQI